MRYLLAFISIFLLATTAQAATLNPDMSRFVHWQYVLDHEQFSPPAHPFAGDLKPVLDQMQARYRQVPYRHSLDLYGDVNHWATRAETRQHHAADCKGIAVAELYDLLELGVPDQDVEIEVVYVLATGEIHAVTRVKDWVLDIRAPRVLSAQEAERFYAPVYAINRIGWRDMQREIAEK